ncbi:hypothetical protein SAY87_017047 [Trapa incisa]|uniref:Alkyl transferase n=1 Tax=Trapa incisa TaxID=236973 RepID=A0AAN7L7V1_9MYRT|nr:hypothetical protein SAY87_017047 [Trapa incisa]
MEVESGYGFRQLFSGLGCSFRKFMFSILSVGPIPDHIAFIMDGNRRFAKKQHLVEGDGHRAGYKSLISILNYCYELGVKYITVYAFSIENFKRQPEEVQLLMDLLVEKIEDLLRDGSIVTKYGMRLYFIGNLGLLSGAVRAAAEKAMRATAHNTRAMLLICVAYTSCDEMVHAVQVSCREKVDETRALWKSELSGVCNGRWVDEGGKNHSDIQMDEGIPIIKTGDVERNMYMSVAPDPNIVIRSSGETRLSNFLLWQTAYSPLYSPAALWPEISLWHLVWVVLDFQRKHSYLQRKRKQS